MPKVSVSDVRIRTQAGSERVTMDIVVKDEVAARELRDIVETKHRNSVFIGFFPEGSSGKYRFEVTGQSKEFLARFLGPNPSQRAQAEFDAIQHNSLEPVMDTLAAAGVFTLNEASELKGGIASASLSIAGRKPSGGGDPTRRIAGAQETPSSGITEEWQR